MKLKMLKVFTSVVLSVLTVFAAYNYIPADYLSLKGEPILGATVTTINGTDTISASRAVINTNFSNLNTNKFELSDWYATTSATQLAKVGTLTTGTWNANTISVAFGGTGSTTLSSNQVLLGNGTTMLKTVGGFGSAGQFLASNGAGLAPTWQSAGFDTTASYNLTGNWVFNATSTHYGTTTILATALQPFVIGTATTTWSLSSPVASTTLMITGVSNGVANISAVRADGLAIASTTLTAAVATTTLTIPNASSDLTVLVEVPSSSGNTSYQLQFNTDTAANYGYTTTEGASSVALGGQKNIVLNTEQGAFGSFFAIHVTGRSTSRKMVTWTGGRIGSGSNVGLAAYGLGVWNNTSSEITSVSIGGGFAGATMAAGTRITVYASRQ